MSTGASARRARLHPLPRRSRPVSAQDQCTPPPPPLQGGLEPRPASCTPHICGPLGPARSKTKLCPWVAGSFRPCEAETPTAAASTTLGPPRVRPRLQAPCPRPHLFKAALGPADAWRVGVGSQHSGMRPYPLTRTGMSRGQRARDQGPGCSVRPRAPAHLQRDVWGPPCTSTQGPAGPDYLQFASSPRSPQPARLPPSPPPASAIHDARDQPLALGSKTLLSRLFPRGEGGGQGLGTGTTDSQDARSQGQGQSGRCLPSSNVPGHSLHSRLHSDFGDRRARLPYRGTCVSSVLRGPWPPEFHASQGADNPRKGLLPEPKHFVQLRLLVPQLRSGAPLRAPGLGSSVPLKGPDGTLCPCSWVCMTPDLAGASEGHCPPHPRTKGPALQGPPAPAGRASPFSHREPTSPCWGSAVPASLSSCPTRQRDREPQRHPRTGAPRPPTRALPHARASCPGSSSARTSLVPGVVSVYTERSMHVCACAHVCVRVCHMRAHRCVPCANACCRVLAACACVFPMCTCALHVCARVRACVQVRVHVQKQTDYNKAPLA